MYSLWEKFKGSIYFEIPWYASALLGVIISLSILVLPAWVVASVTITDQWTTQDGDLVSRLIGVPLVVWGSLAIALRFFLKKDNAMQKIVFDAFFLIFLLFNVHYLILITSGRWNFVMMLLHCAFFSVGTLLSFPYTSFYQSDMSAPVDKNGFLVLVFGGAALSVFGALRLSSPSLFSILTNSWNSEWIWTDPTTIHDSIVQLGLTQLVQAWVFYSVAKNLLGKASETMTQKAFMVVQIALAAHWLLTGMLLFSAATGTGRYETGFLWVIIPALFTVGAFVLDSKPPKIRPKIKGTNANK